MATAKAAQPVTQTNAGFSFTVKRADIVRAMQDASLFTSKDRGRPVLSGVEFRLDDSGYLHINTADGFALAHTTVKYQGARRAQSITLQSAAHTDKLAGASTPGIIPVIRSLPKSATLVTFALEASAADVVTGVRVSAGESYDLTVPVVWGTYPDVAKLLRQHEPTSAHANPWMVDANTILDLTTPYSADARQMRGKVAKDHIRPVFLWAHAGTLARVTCQDRDSNGNPFSLSRAELVPSLRDKAEAIIAVNSVYLRTIASAHKGERLAIHLHPDNPASQAMHVSVNARCTYLVMPVVIGELKEAVVSASIDDVPAWKDAMNAKQAAKSDAKDAKPVPAQDCPHGFEAGTYCNFCETEKTSLRAQSAAAAKMSPPVAPPSPAVDVPAGETIGKRHYGKCQHGRYCGFGCRCGDCEKLGLMCAAMIGAHAPSLCGGVLADGVCTSCGASAPVASAPAVKTAPASVTPAIATQRKRAAKLAPAPKPGTVNHLCAQCGKIMQANAPKDQARAVFDVCHECDPDTNAKQARANAERAARVQEVAAVQREGAVKRHNEAVERENTMPVPARTDDRRAKFCPTCGTPAEPDDNYCAECGRKLHARALDTAQYRELAEKVQAVTIDAAIYGAQLRTRESVSQIAPDPTPAPVNDDTPAQAPALDADEESARAASDADVEASYVPIDNAYSGKNPGLILAQCPHASDVRGFHAWLKVGRAVMKGQKAIRLWAIDASSDGKAKPKSITVFDISQTDYARPRKSA